MDTLALLREIKARMEREYVKPLSFDFVLKKIIEKENHNTKLIRNITFYFKVNIIIFISLRCF